MKRNWVFVWPLLAMLIAGCGGDSGGEAAPNEGQAQSDGQIKRRTAASLPAVGDYLPPQKDGGNEIEIAPPADWKPMPRDSRYLARFVKGNISELPRITIEAWDSPVPDITELTEENADRLAADLVKQLKRDKKTVPEPPKPIVLGDTLFLRHVRRARLASGGNVVIQALDTVRGGRIYTVELIADIDAARAEDYEGSLKNWRDYGYAVAANLKITSGSEPSPDAQTPALPAEAPAPDNSSP